MRWVTSLMIATIVSMPLTVGAQAHRADHAPLEPYLEQADETPAAAPESGAVAMMPCPMMGQGGMGRGPMPGMMPGASGHRGMGAQTGAAAHGRGGPHAGMMGMMAVPGPEADPKARARWMQMRGEMMKAMGEILLRYGRDLETGK